MLVLLARAPPSGSWIVETELERTDCPTAPAGVMTGPLTLTVDVDRVFVDPPFVTCPVAGHTFSCPLRPLEVSADYGLLGLEAVVTTSVWMEGAWVAGTPGGTFTTSTSCAGTECADLDASAPPRCTSTWRWGAR